ncbi:MAG TPA: hypothetical protein VJ890_21175 [Vineibacter sp.]|nr:hypothetical protein [Vineibacter sp.]
MAVIYRTTGPWGPGVGRNLTAAEIDGNFYDQQVHLAGLEDSRPQPDDITSVSTNGTQLTFHLESGATLGPVDMPVLAWRWRDEWEPFTIYAAMDTFSVGEQGIFLTLLDHTSAAEFDPAATTGDPPLPVYQQLIGVGTGARLGELNDVDVTGAAADALLVAVAGSPVTWEDRTPAQVTATLAAFSGDSGTGGAKGLVPAPAANDATARKVLGASGNWEHPRTPGFIVANLPAAGTAGRRAHVTDANSTTFGAVVAGGGSNTVPVMDTGAAWIIG